MTAVNSNGTLDIILDFALDSIHSSLSLIERTLTDRTVPDSEDGVNPTADTFFLQMRGRTIDKFLSFFVRVRAFEDLITPGLLERRRIRVIQGYQP